MSFLHFCKFFKVFLPKQPDSATNRDSPFIPNPTVDLLHLNPCFTDNLINKLNIFRKTLDLLQVDGALRVLRAETRPGASRAGFCGAFRARARNCAGAAPPPLRICAGCCVRLAAAARACAQQPRWRRCRRRAQHSHARSRENIILIKHSC